MTMMRVTFILITALKHNIQTLKMMTSFQTLQEETSANNCLSKLQYLPLIQVLWSVWVEGLRTAVLFLPVTKDLTPQCPVYEDTWQHMILTCTRTWSVRYANMLGLMTTLEIWGSMWPASMARTKTGQRKMWLLISQRNCRSSEETPLKTLDKKEMDPSYLSCQKFQSA